MRLVSAPKQGWSAWRFVAWFGVVSLLGDFVYEGARSVTGPFLHGLGASAALVGLVTGAGEMFALAGRLGSGPLADRTRAYWPIAIAGYALTMVSVPLLGLTSVLGVAAALIIAERAGKALRSPAKDVMLSHATAKLGRGRGFGVHEALDQAGAIIGPLVVAAVLAQGGGYGLAFGLLALPGAAALGLLLWLRRQVPDPSRFDPETDVRATKTRDWRSVWQFSPAFWWYLAFTAITTAGFTTFGVLGFHLVAKHVVGAPAVPVIYAAVMAAAGVAALATGWWYDRLGRATLAVVPPLTLATALLAFSDTPWMAVTGAMLWGAVLGMQESTMRAAVADLVPAARRGTAYGVFALGFGAATLVGGVLVGALYDHSLTALLTAELAIQSLAVVVFVVAQKTASSKL